MNAHRAKIYVLSTLILMIILVFVGYFTLRPDKIQASTAIPTQNQPTIGNLAAPIHFVVFEDLKCIACKSYNTQLYPQIEAKYIRTGKASYTFMNLAFIEGSMPAANAARCLYDQNKDFFFPFVDYVYQHQPPESENWATISTLLQFAKASVPAANLEKLSQCLMTSSHAPFIRNNEKLASTVMHGEIATPSLYVNGVKVDSLNLGDIDHLVNQLKAAHHA